MNKKNVSLVRQRVERFMPFILCYILCLVFFAPYWTNAYPSNDDIALVAKGVVFNLYDWFITGNRLQHTDFKEWGNTASHLHVRPIFQFIYWMLDQVANVLPPYWSAYRLLYLLIVYPSLAGCAAFVYHCGRGLYGHGRITASLLALAMAFCGAFGNRVYAIYAFCGLDGLSALLFGLCLYALVYKRVIAVILLSVLASNTKELALPGLVIASAFCIMIPNWRRFGLALATGPACWYLLRLLAFANGEVQLSSSEPIDFNVRVFANIPMLYSQSLYNLYGDRFHAYDLVVLANALFVLLWAYALWVIVRRIRYVSDIRSLIDEWTGTPAAMLRSLLVILVGTYYVLYIVFYVNNLFVPRYFAIPMLVMFLGLAAYVPRVFVRLTIPVISLSCVLASFTVVYNTTYLHNALYRYQIAMKLERLIQDLNAQKPGRKIYIVNNIAWAGGGIGYIKRYLNAPGLENLSYVTYTLGKKIKQEPYRYKIRQGHDHWTIQMKHPDIVIPLLNGKGSSIARSLSENGKRISVQNIRYDFDRIDVEEDKNGVGRVVGYGNKVTYHILNPPSGTALIIWNYEKLRWEVHE